MRVYIIYDETVLDFLNMTRINATLHDIANGCATSSIYDNHVAYKVNDFKIEKAFTSHIR